MKPKLTIVKIGGNVIDNPELLDSVLADFAKLENAKILVHGGGKLATRLGEKLGIEAKFHKGRRITDQAMLEIAVMSYAGGTNKSIVAKLQALGVNAIGLTGADGNLILSEKRAVKTVDFGFVGDVRKVDSEALRNLIQCGFVPVFAAITHDGKGKLLNTNADTIASEIAIACSDFFDTELLYCFEKPGVLANSEDGDSVISLLDAELYQRLKAENKVHSGMLPKLDNCFRALENGVSVVKVGSEKLLSDQNSGTKIQP
ncbi:acetylglutamate kinase [Flavobacterium sp. MAH-1]|uniref:Acetylglutamate kinase n=1 Tax=Flavobacterium agri TaxID=2743471 RepID=A0A7Y9C7N3_9FLAO|nr:acetylglutamate kinase [Flavobacterium agri]NUY82535.1 acetylglutamate kinase [Flavobacterium agri]NYA72559.1 acetylglutamate kinase [Flavobacterium agri]